MGMNDMEKANHSLEHSEFIRLGGTWEAQDMEQHNQSPKQDQLGPTSNRLN